MSGAVQQTPALSSTHSSLEQFTVLSGYHPHTQVLSRSVNSTAIIRILNSGAVQ